jgi:hypothetical protein
MPGIKRYELNPLALPRFVHDRARPAREELRVAHDTLQGIFDSLHAVRVAARVDKDARGRLNEGEVDLLRSAVVLAGAGMEAVIKRLVTDALPMILAQPAKHPLAVAKYEGPRHHVVLRVGRSRRPPTPPIAGVTLSIPITMRFGLPGR